MSYNEAHARAVRKYHRTHRDRMRARRALWKALKAGRITRTSCARCGSTIGLHGHHEDYSRPLDVVWLCGPCHISVHKVKRGTAAKPERPIRMKNRILELRRERGLTSRDLALLTGLNPQHLESIERGQTIPRLDTARKCTKALGVTLAEAFPSGPSPAANE